jgi:hypothetical protein
MATIDKSLFERYRALSASTPSKLDQPILRVFVRRIGVAAVISFSLMFPHLLRRCFRAGVILRYE